jgi:dUTP pyrophosphatase
VSAAPPRGPLVAVERLPHGEGLPLPAYATVGSSGADLRAAVAGELWIAAGERRLVPTGFKLAIPPGYEGQIRPRSGLALRHGVTLPNSPGTIDADYRGEILVALVNLSSRPFRVRRGDRIAQLVVAPVATARFAERASLDGTSRGDGGFGSTGSG